MIKRSTWKPKPKPIVHTEHSIQKLLVAQYRNGAKYLVPNMHHRFGEMDLFMLRRSGYAEEFEIKVTTADLRADSKKIRKHKFMNHRYDHSQALFLCRPFPNKFSYVLGEKVGFVLKDIPEHYGVYQAVNHRLICIRSPKFIHKEKYDWYEKIAGSCSWRLLKALKLTRY